MSYRNGQEAARGQGRIPPQVRRASKRSQVLDLATVNQCVASDSAAQPYLAIALGAETPSKFGVCTYIYIDFYVYVLLVPSSSRSETTKMPSGKNILLKYYPTYLISKAKSDNLVLVYGEIC